MRQGEGDVPLNREVGEEVELLKNNPNSRSNCIGVNPGVRDVISTEPDLPIINLLKKVDAPQEC